MNEETQPLIDESNISDNEGKEPSYFIRNIRSIFGFRKTSLTLLVMFTYIIITITLPLLKSYNFKLPSSSPTYLTSCWTDLQRISEKPHPYISHANDEVHDYILERVIELSMKKPSYIMVEDDNSTILDVLKSTWNSSSEASPLHYFESGNILVKIEGTDPTLDGVLLSAHYDSVPTAFGTTDDGTGIASLLGVLEYLTSENSTQPLRTIIFNFNNNEEFGLFGAVAFMRHRWCQLVKYFINLEGTGIGDRAILFRTTDYDITTFYDSVRNPYASSIYQEGFSNGLIHSETDYRIYANGGLRGFDIAFYKPRSLYHTRKDNIQFTSKNALWHMLSQTIDLVDSLANSENIGDDIETQAVFFDFLGLFFINFRLNDLIIINLILLSIVPIFLIIFGLIIQKRNNWKIGIAWIRLPISIFISLISTNFLLKIIIFWNPFIASRDFINPLILTSSTFLFINYAILTTWNTLSPICDLKLLITLEIYFALWIILAILTYYERKDNIMTGKYLFSILYVLYSIASLFGLFSFAISSPKTEKIVVPKYGSSGGDSGGIEDIRRINDIEQVRDENIPLLAQVNESEHKSFTYDWSLQFLILVPLSFILSYSSINLILDGLNQTMQESLHSQDLVYKLILGSGLILTIPILSFAYKLNYLFAILLIISIISSGFLCISKQPFTEDLPIKFRFVQTLNLNQPLIKPMVDVYGREGFLSEILSDLPSVKKSKQEINCTYISDGSELCSYIGLEPNLIDKIASNSSYQFDKLLNFEIIKNSNKEKSPYSPSSIELKINSLENRYCHLTFNTSSFVSYKYGKSPIKIFTYYHDLIDTNLDENKDSVGFKWLPGIDDIHLHKLSWNQTSYHIGLQWIPQWLEEGGEPPQNNNNNNNNNELTINVACYYGEYDDISIINGEIKRKIPAFDEILEYSPLWSSWSNRFEGLVVIEKSITV